MRGIRIDFSSGGPVFDFSRQVYGLELAGQSALVNLGNDVASDPLHQSRGTDLKRAGARGQLINQATAQHEANFAAIQTLAFLQQTQPEHNLRRLALSVVSLQDQQIEVTLQVADDTQTRGLSAAL